MQNRGWLVLVLLACLVGCATNPPLSTVDRVDLGRYLGKWYEIARLPQSFEDGCVAVTAQYSPQGDGTVAVVNACRRGSLSGRADSISGRARVVDPQTNAKLKVMFFWPFEGDYWILRLAPDYSAAAVGSPDRKTLWFLSRTPTMDPALYDQWTASLKADGFPVEKLERTVQPAP